MRDWRNRQTRTFKGRVGDRVSSSLTSRTKKKSNAISVALFLRAKLLRKQQLATVVANVRCSSMSARPRRHLRLPLPKHLAPFWQKLCLTNCVAPFFCARGCCIFLYDVATSGGMRNPFIYIFRNWKETLLLSTLGCVSALGCVLSTLGCTIKQVALRCI